MFSREFYKSMDTATTSSTTCEKIDVLKQIFTMLNQKYTSDMLHMYAIFGGGEICFHDTRRVVNELIKHNAFSFNTSVVYPRFNISHCHVVFLFLQNLRKRCGGYIQMSAVQSFVHLCQMCGVNPEKLLKSFIFELHRIYITPCNICELCNKHVDDHETHLTYGKL